MSCVFVLFIVSSERSKHQRFGAPVALNKGFATWLFKAAHLFLNATTFMQLLEKYPQMLSMRADNNTCNSMQAIRTSCVTGQMGDSNIISDDIGFTLSYVKGVIGNEH